MMMIRTRRGIYETREKDRTGKSLADEEETKKHNGNRKQNKKSRPDNTKPRQKPDRTRPTDGAGTLNSQTIGEVGKEQNSKALPAVESFMTVSI